MDWLLDFLREFASQFLAPIIGTVLAWFVAKLVMYITKLVKKGITSIDNTMIQTFVKLAAREVVNYVEQKYKDLKGTEKYQKALEAMEEKADDFTQRIGLGREVVSDTDIAVAIEAAVKEMSTQWELSKKPPFGGQG